MRKRYVILLCIIPFLFSIVLLTSIKNYPIEHGEEGLVGYWKFDEGYGNITNDSSGNGNTGIIYGANWTYGKEGFALYFDGIDDFVKIPNSESLNTTEYITIEAWVNSSNWYDGEWRAIISKKSVNDSNSYRLLKTPHADIYFGIGKNNSSDSGTRRNNTFSRLWKRYLRKGGRRRNL